MNYSTVGCLLFAMATPALTQSPNCNVPAVLRITQQAGDVVYQLDKSTPHKLYSLGEVSKAVRQCSPEKAIFVVASPEVPLKYVRLPGKEQITTDRYFIQYFDGRVQEIKFDLLYPKLPLTSDVIGHGVEEDGPPPTAVRR